MKLISLSIIVFLPPIIFASNFLYLIFAKSTYDQIFQSEGIYQNFSQKEEALYLINNLHGYFRGKNVLEQNFFSTQAILHLNDVKQIFQTIKILNLVSLALLCFSIIYLFRARECELIVKSLIRGSIFAIVSTILISSIFILNFNYAFEKLHLILFRNNLWLFDSTDSLFKLFPQNFFMAFARILTADIIVTSLIIAYLAKSMTHKND